MNLPYSLGSIEVCKTLGRHGDILFSTAYDSDKKQVRKFVLCLCCKTVEEIIPPDKEAQDDKG